MDEFTTNQTSRSKITKSKIFTLQTRLQTSSTNPAKYGTSPLMYDSDGSL